MASFFRKLGHNFVPMFRKLPGEVARIGRKIYHGAGDAQNYLNKAAGVIAAADRIAPNPILKIARGVVGGAAGVAGGVSAGGSALNQLGQGHYKQAGRLGQQGLSQITQGGNSLMQGATQAAPYVLPLLL